MQLRTGIRKTTIRIPAELLLETKKYAKKCGVTLNECIISELWNAYEERGESERKRREKNLKIKRLNEIPYEIRKIEESIEKEQNPLQKKFFEELKRDKMWERVRIREAIGDIPKV